jgi:hypothetical protein
MLFAVPFDARGGQEGRCKGRLSLMKPFFFGMLVCMAVALPALADEIVDPDMMGLGLQTREAAPPISSHDPSRCLDGMVTEPWSNDLEPTPSAMDASCTVAERPIAT